MNIVVTPVKISHQVLPRPTSFLARLRRMASQGLVDIFSSLGGNRWKNREGWLTPGTDVKRWHGITVNAGKLVSLNLISNDLEVCYETGYKDASSMMRCTVSRHPEAVSVCALFNMATHSESNYTNVYQLRPLLYACKAQPSLLFPSRGFSKATTDVLTTV